MAERNPEMEAQNLARAREEIFQVFHRIRDSLATQPAGEPQLPERKEIIDVICPLRRIIRQYGEGTRFTAANNDIWAVLSEEATLGERRMPLLTLSTTTTDPTDRSASPGKYGLYFSEAVNVPGPEKAFYNSLIVNAQHIPASDSSTDIPGELITMIITLQNRYYYDLDVTRLRGQQSLRVRRGGHVETR